MNDNTCPQKPFRVLSLDGGGMRGLYTATLLNHLAYRFTQQRNCKPLDIGKGFDLIVGTSTGGILACALAKGVPISQISNLYCEQGPQIFTDPMPPKSHYRKFLGWCFRNRSKASNTNHHLRNALKQIFGDTTLEQLHKTRGIALCIPSVKMLKETARVFKTPHNPIKNLDNKYTLADICLATSAAPIFLPMVALDSPTDDKGFDVFVDGGLWANNPVLVGLIEALELCNDNRPIEILSIGTCATHEGDIYQRNEVDKGLKDWQVGAKALTTAMNAQASGSDFMATLLATHLTKLGHPIKVVRLKETAPSTEQLKHLRLDLASTKALDALTSLGNEDGISAFRLCQNPNDHTGQLLTSIFNSMPELA